MKFIHTDDAPAAIGPYSQGVRVGDLIFFSGQIALRADGSFEDGDVQTQTKQVFQNIKALLVSQDLKPENIVKATVFLSSMDDFVAVNEIYSNYFGGHKPARSCVEVSKLPKNALVEIEVICSVSE